MNSSEYQKNLAELNDVSDELNATVYTTATGERRVIASGHMNDKEAAIESARKHNQVSILDWERLHAAAEHGWSDEWLANPEHSPFIPTGGKWDKAPGSYSVAAETLANMPTEGALKQAYAWAATQPAGHWVGEAVESIMETRQKYLDGGKK